MMPYICMFKTSEKPISNHWCSFRANIYEYSLVRLPEPDKLSLTSDRRVCCLASW